MIGQVLALFELVILEIIHLTIKQRIYKEEKLLLKRKVIPVDNFTTSTRTETATGSSDMTLSTTNPGFLEELDILQRMSSTLSPRTSKSLRRTHFAVLITNMNVNTEFVFIGSLNEQTKKNKTL